MSSTECKSKSDFEELNSIEVSIGVLRNQEGQILVSQRQSSQSFAGFWEFPGGKLETAESPYGALVREFKEEVNIIISNAKEMPLIEYQHNDVLIRLFVWNVCDYLGVAEGREGQKIRWVYLNELKQLQMPASNSSILLALDDAQRNNFEYS